MSRRAPRPLEPPPSRRPSLHFATTALQLVADIRAHFPEFEAQLAREYPDYPLDAFATQPPGALLFVLMRLTEAEHRRREQFIASLLRAGPDPNDLAALERLAIQEEGTDQRAETEATERPGASQTDRVAEPRGVPPQPPGP